MKESKQTAASWLMDVGAIRFGEFRLKMHETKPDAPLSPIYVDLRILRSYPDAMDAVIQVYRELIADLRFDCIADVPTAATPIVALLAYHTRTPMVSPRKEEKGYGIKRQIDGVFRAGQVALLVDDLITRADSKLDAISALEENGLKVCDVAILVDREQGGVQEMERRGYHCHAAYRLSELLDFYLSTSRISPDDYHRTVGYLRGESA